MALKAFFESLDENFVAVFEYTNWRGEKSTRRARPLYICFGYNEWHPEHQWLMFAKDLDKDGEVRAFAMKDMRDVRMYST